MGEVKTKFSYYVVFSYLPRDRSQPTTLGCRDVDLSGPLDDPEVRKGLASSLALEFPNLVIVNWKRNQ